MFGPVTEREAECAQQHVFGSTLCAHCHEQLSNWEGGGAFQPPKERGSLSSSAWRRLSSNHQRPITNRWWLPISCRLLTANRGHRRTADGFPGADLSRARLGTESAGVR